MQSPWIPFAKENLFAKARLLLDGLYYKIFLLLIREKTRKFIFTFFRDVSMHLTYLLVQPSSHPPVQIHPLRSACHFSCSFKAWSCKLFSTWIAGVSFYLIRVFFLPWTALVPPIHTDLFQLLKHSCLSDSLVPNLFIHSLWPFSWVWTLSTFSSKWYLKKDQITKTQLNTCQSKTTNYLGFL